MPDFTISIDRIGYGQRDITVKDCDTQEQAEAKVLDEAGGYEFSEHASDYVLSNRPTPQEQRKADAHKKDVEEALTAIRGLLDTGVYTRMGGDALNAARNFIRKHMEQ